MKKHRELLESLYLLIDIQIKKYVGLSKIGVGPDAELNAKLVLNQVNELLGFANELLIMLEKYNNNSEKMHVNTSDEVSYEKIFFQIKFYLEMEHLRAHAGWLLDDNFIHNPLHKRVSEQMIKLKEIGNSAGIDINVVKLPSTTAQEQCEHDSYSIAYKILDLAIKLKKDPEMDMDSVPMHAKIIMRKHAKPDGRYFKDEIFQPIVELYNQCNDFMSKSTLTTTTDILPKESILKQAEEHREQFKESLQRFKTLVPNSSLFASDNIWYEVGKDHTKKNNSQYPGFFGMAACATFVLCMYALFYYLNLSQENNLSNKPLHKGL